MTVDVRPGSVYLLIMKTTTTQMLTDRANMFAERAKAALSRGEAGEAEALRYAKRCRRIRDGLRRRGLAS